MTDILSTLSAQLASAADTASASIVLLDAYSQAVTSACDAWAPPSSSYPIATRDVDEPREELVHLGRIGGQIAEVPV